MTCLQLAEFATRISAIEAAAAAVETAAVGNDDTQTTVKIHANASAGRVFRAEESRED